MNLIFTICILLFFCSTLLLIKTINDRITEKLQLLEYDIKNLSSHLDNTNNVMVDNIIPSIKKQENDINFYIKKLNDDFIVLEKNINFNLVKKTTDDESLKKEDLINEINLFKIALDEQYEIIDEKIKKLNSNCETLFIEMKKIK